MANQELLNDSLLSINTTIRTFLKEDITRPYSACKNLGGSIWCLVDMYRGRAIIRFLLEADVDGFFEDLHREALTYHTLLKAYHQGFDVESDLVNAETEGPLLCAMAAGNFNLAREIDALMPRQQDDPEGQEFFTYTNMLRALAAGTEQAISTAFQEFQRMCSGKFRFDEKIAILEGLVQRDAAAFNEALSKYLESFEQLSPEEQEELDPGAEDIDILALALVQVARRRSVPLTVEHRMLPPELLDPRVRMPQDGYPAWP
ncbi:Imm49 family immunity protein [Archangium lansingense]|uniref:Imm49 family immunity protein n=1 Tax=Archangium lansingense TaxID=2995310 RepID=A0ABT4AIR3_9BACT|nr:Imm49 family immunity protein [Archangium lansinium]MCY1080752.1 Imm49 family immunity protein [Archangium lansinium]